MKPLLTFFALGVTISGAWLAGSESPDLTERKRVAARTQIMVFQSALERLYKDLGRHPSSEEGLDALYHAPAKDAVRWKGPYLRADLPVDPWTHAYRYRLPATKSAVGFDIWSLGPDGIESDDDVGNWTK